MKSVSFVAVLNVSPESRVPGSVATGEQEILHKARELLEAGADWVELGARSISEGVARLSDAEEQERLMPVLAHLAAEGIPLMVDTWSEETAIRSVEAGVGIVNFTGRHPSRSFHRYLGEHDVPMICTFMAYADAYDMRDQPCANYGLDEILSYFREEQEKAKAEGCRIIADPNLGIFHPEISDADKLAYQLQAIDALLPLGEMGLERYIYSPRKESLVSRQLMAQLIHRAGPEFVRVHEPRIYQDAAAALDRRRETALI